MSEINTWDKTAGNNNSAAPDGWPENMAPSGVNDSARENMAAAARLYADMNGTLTSGGAADAQTLTSNRTISAYAAGISFIFKAGFTNTGACTLNLNGIGAKAVKKKGGTALVAGDITVNEMIHVIYDGTDWDMVGVESAVLTDAEIKTQYENNSNTNEFSDAEQKKLSDISVFSNDFSNAEQRKLRIALPSDTSRVVQTSTQITNIVKMTQAAYDRETPDANTLYIIVR